MPSTGSSERTRLGYAYTLVAGISFSFTALFSTFLKNLGVPSIEQGFFRISFTAVFFGIVLLLRSSLRHIDRTDVKFFVINGLFGICLSITAYLSSIALGTPLAVAITLSYLQPMFSVILARVFLSETITRMRVVAVVTSIIGASIVSGIWEVFSAAMQINIVGVLLATLNGFFYSVYVIVGRLSGSSKSYHFETTMFYSFFFGLLWMAPIWLLISEFIKEPIVTGFVVAFLPEAWTYLVLIAVVATIIPYGLLALGLRNLKASKAGILLLIEPVCVMIMQVFGPR